MKAYKMHPSMPWAYLRDAHAEIMVARLTYRRAGCELAFRTPLSSI